MDTASDTRDIVNKKKAERPSSDKEVAPNTGDGKIGTVTDFVPRSASTEAIIPAPDATSAHA